MNHLDDGILIKTDKQNIVSTNNIINPYIPENHKKMLKEGSIIDVNKLTIKEHLGDSLPICIGTGSYQGG